MLLTFNIFQMLKLFLKHANMQDANSGHTTAAPDNPKLQPH